VILIYLLNFEEDAKVGLLAFINLKNFLTKELEVKVDLMEKNELKKLAIGGF